MGPHFDALDIILLLQQQMEFIQGAAAELRNNTLQLHLSTIASSWTAACMTLRLKAASKTRELLLLLDTELGPQSLHLSTLYKQAPISLLAAQH